MDSHTLVWPLELGIRTPTLLRGPSPHYMRRNWGGGRCKCGVSGEG